MSRVVVVKCGGNAAVAYGAVCADIAALAGGGMPVVLVHGGSAEIDRLAGRLHVPNRRLVAPDGVSTRHTDAAMMEVVQLALLGAVKPRLVAELSRHSVAAVGLSGLDAGLVTARRKGAHRAVAEGRTVIVRDSRAGRIETVDPRILRTLLAAGVIPVVSPPVADADGEPVNVDADRVAAAIAVALGASSLVLLTGAPGVLRDPADRASLIPELVLGDGAPPSFAGGGMGLKLVAAREALNGGVDRVIVAAGDVPNPLEAALAGGGTSVTSRGAGAGT